MPTVSEMFPRPRPREEDLEILWLCGVCVSRRRDLRYCGQIWGVPARSCEGCRGFNGALFKYEILKGQNQQKLI